MTPDTVAVLVVPSEGDPGGLLAPGRCGIIPALAELRHGCDPNGPPTPKEWTLTSNRWTDDAALPLWWDGALVPEGWDRFMRRYPSARDEAGEHPTLADVLEVLRAEPVRYGLVGRVVRLARVDGRLVEVQP